MIEKSSAVAAHQVDAGGLHINIVRTDFIYDCTPCFLHSCALIASRSTGKERDAESGLDYFGARYDGSMMGRWMSPDWSAKAEPVPYAKLDNPQSLNLYAYVGNNPLSQIDEDGHLASPWHFFITYAAAVATGGGPFHGVFSGLREGGQERMG
jgi:RHS repeat-associated protein